MPQGRGCYGDGRRHARCPTGPRSRALVLVRLCRCHRHARSGVVMGRAAAAVSLFDDAAAATLAGAGGAASAPAAAGLLDSLRAAALSRVLTTGAPRCLGAASACFPLTPPRAAQAKCRRLRAWPTRRTAPPPPPPPRAHCTRTARALPPPSSSPSATPPTARFDLVIRCDGRRPN